MDIVRDLHWIINSSTPSVSTVIEKAFLDAGIVRKIGAILPDTVPIAVAGTDMATVIGRDNFMLAERQYGLASTKLPVKMPQLQGRWSGRKLG
jgi:hypothetical protein